MREERLLRSRKDYVIGGVAGGFGEYLKIDPVIIRIIFVITAFLGGGGLIVYILLWIFVAENENQIITNNMEEEKMKNRKKYSHHHNMHEDEFYNERKKRGNIIGGLSVLTIGILFLIDNFIPGVNFSDLWPVILVAVGIGMIFSGLLSTKKNDKNENNKEEANTKPSSS